MREDFAWFIGCLPDAIALYRCPGCGRKIGGELTVVPIEGETQTIRIKPEPELGCSTCRVFAPVRVELREPAAGEPFLTPEKLTEMVIGMFRQVGQDTFLNAAVPPKGLLN